MCIPQKLTKHKQSISSLSICGPNFYHIPANMTRMIKKLSTMQRAMSKHQGGEIDVSQNLGINQDMGWYVETGLYSSEQLPRYRRHGVSSGIDTIICAQYDALTTELFGCAQSPKD
jgi:hypothetical protein